MEQNKEISALLRLIDDPDLEVYDTVASRLLNYGKEIIPDLEHLWQLTESEDVQERIETLIHRVHFENLQADFVDWAHSRHPEILRGAILVAKYQFPDLNVPAVLTQFDQIRRNIWMELNNYLTPIEQVNVFNSILYNYYKLHGHELTEREPKYFFINQVMESKQGNAYTLGVLYLALSELLDIPIRAVNIPRQFILSYLEGVPGFLGLAPADMQQIQFFLDPITGMVYSRKDVDTYLKKINATEKESYYKPLSTQKVIYKMLEELHLCYRYRNEFQKADEIGQLMQLLA